MILRRLPDSRFSEILPNWKGETAALFAGGPSLIKDHVEQVKAAGIKCIAINNSYQIAPFANVLYFADVRWWEAHKDRGDFKAFAGERCGIENTTAKLADDSIHVMRNFHAPCNDFGLSLDPQKLVTGKHGGFQALNLAILAGAAKILLLGFDGKADRNGKSHWHKGHADPTPQSAYDVYKQSFIAAQNEIKATGVRVLNCSPSSAIYTFEKMSLEDALKATVASSL